MRVRRRKRAAVPPVTYRFQRFGEDRYALRWETSCGLRGIEFYAGNPWLLINTLREAGHTVRVR